MMSEHVKKDKKCLIEHITLRTLTSKNLGNFVCLEGIVTKCSSNKDYQSLTIQELPEATPAGQLPMSLDVFCWEQLMHAWELGDKVQIEGTYGWLPGYPDCVNHNALTRIVMAERVKLPQSNEPDFQRVTGLDKEKTPDNDGTHSPHLTETDQDTEDEFSNQDEELGKEHIERNQTKRKRKKLKPTSARKSGAQWRKITLLVDTDDSSAEEEEWTKKQNWRNPKTQEVFRRKINAQQSKLDDLPQMTESSCDTDIEVAGLKDEFPTKTAVEIMKTCSPLDAFKNRLSPIETAENNTAMKVANAVEAKTMDQSIREMHESCNSDESNGTPILVIKDATGVFIKTESSEENEIVKHAEGSCIKKLSEWIEDVCGESCSVDCPLNSLSFLSLKDGWNINNNWTIPQVDGNDEENKNDGDEDDTHNGDRSNDQPNEDETGEEEEQGDGPKEQSGKGTTKKKFHLNHTYKIESVYFDDQNEMMIRMSIIFNPLPNNKDMSATKYPIILSQNTVENGDIRQAIRSQIYGRAVFIKNIDTYRRDLLTEIQWAYENQNNGVVANTVVMSHNKPTLFMFGGVAYYSCGELWKLTDPAVKLNEDEVSALPFVVCYTGEKLQFKQDEKEMTKLLLEIFTCMFKMQPNKRDNSWPIVYTSRGLQNKLYMINLPELKIPQPVTIITSAEGTKVGKTLMAAAVANMTKGTSGDSAGKFSAPEAFKVVKEGVDFVVEELPDMSKTLKDNVLEVVKLQFQRLQRTMGRNTGFPNATVTIQTNIPIEAWNMSKADFSKILWINAGKNSLKKLPGELKGPKQLQEEMVDASEKLHQYYPGLLGISFRSSGKKITDDDIEKYQDIIGDDDRLGQEILNYDRFLSNIREKAIKHGIVMPKVIEEPADFSCMLGREFEDDDEEEAVEVLSPDVIANHIIACDLFDELIWGTSDGKECIRVPVRRLSNDLISQVIEQHQFSSQNYNSTRVRIIPLEVFSPEIQQRLTLGTFSFCKVVCSEYDLYLELQNKVEEEIISFGKTMETNKRMEKDVDPEANVGNAVPIAVPGPSQTRKEAGGSVDYFDAKRLLSLPPGPSKQRKGKKSQLASISVDTSNEDELNLELQVSGSSDDELNRRGKKRYMPAGDNFDTSSGSSDEEESPRKEDKKKPKVNSTGIVENAATKMTQKEEATPAAASTQNKSTKQTTKGAKKEKKFVCQRCPKKYVIAAYLKKHMLLVHKVE